MIDWIVRLSLFGRHFGLYRTPRAKIVVLGPGQDYSIDCPSTVGLMLGWAYIAHVSSDFWWNFRHWKTWSVGWLR